MKFNYKKNKNNINKHNIALFYKIWKNYNEIQLTKNKIDWNNRKMLNHPPSPGSLFPKAVNELPRLGLHL